MKYETKIPKHKMATTQTNKYLHFVKYSTLLLWDIKRYFMTQVSSSYPIVRLGDFIEEENAKCKINDPAKTYGILGVNNQTGIFDAYLENGSKIKQKYKEMHVGWIAYNPYRVNVGSIGMRTEKQMNEYISPAYVVFSCKERLLPQFLYILMKTDKFNKIIRDNTTGSVRQNLNYSVLSDLQIPLPSLEEQNKIVAAYNEALANADQCAKKAQVINEQIESYLKKALELKKSNTSIRQNTVGKFIWLAHLKNLSRWDVYNTQSSIYDGAYEHVLLKEILVSHPKYGAGYKAEKKQRDVRYIRITDINEDGSLNEDYASVAKYDKQYLLKQNDFLIARTGNTVGKTFLYDECMGKAIYAGYLIKFELNTDKVNPHYLLAYTKSSIYKTWIKNNMRVSAQPNINSKQYEESPIILPPLDIQNDIVAHIVALRTEQKNLQQQASELRQQAKQQFEQTIFN